jgi:hypothetical protein
MFFALLLTTPFQVSSKPRGDTVYLPEEWIVFY